MRRPHTPQIPRGRGARSRRRNPQRHPHRTCEIRPGCGRPRCHSHAARIPACGTLRGAHAPRRASPLVRCLVRLGDARDTGGRRLFAAAGRRTGGTGLYDPPDRFLRHGRSGGSPGLPRGSRSVRRSRTGPAMALRQRRHPDRRRGRSGHQSVPGLGGDLRNPGGGRGGGGRGHRLPARRPVGQCRQPGRTLRTGGCGRRWQRLCGRHLRLELHLFIGLPLRFEQDHPGGARHARRRNDRRGEQQRQGGLRRGRRPRRPYGRAPHQLPDVHREQERQRRRSSRTQIRRRCGCGHQSEQLGLHQRLFDARGHQGCHRILHQIRRHGRERRTGRSDEGRHRDLRRRQRGKGLHELSGLL